MSFEWILMIFIAILVLQLKPTNLIIAQLIRKKQTSEIIIVSKCIFVHRVFTQKSGGLNLFIIIFFKLTIFSIFAVVHFM